MERQCDKCLSRKKKGCSKWDCEFEPRLSDSFDTLICADKEEAKQVIDNVEGKYIYDFDYLEGGKVQIVFNCKITEIPEKGGK